MKRRAILGFGLAAIAIGAIALVRSPLHPPFPTPFDPLTVNALRGGVYWVSGGVSNTGFIVGDKGVIVIDSQTFMGSARKVLADIAKITPDPVNEIILTHSDPDHVNALPAYPRGLEIIAQDNAAAEMRSFLADPKANGLAAPPEIKNYMPTRTIKDRASLVLDGVPVVLIHTGPAHTDGDLIIYLPNQKIVFAGDILVPGATPFAGIHLNKHGSSLGWIQFAKAMLALDADTFVCGHGGVMTRAEVQARIEAVEQRRAQIQAYVDQHMTLDQIKAKFNDPPPTGIAARFPTFTETTYQELTAK